MAHRRLFSLVLSLLLVVTCHFFPTSHAATTGADVHVRAYCTGGQPPFSFIVTDSATGTPRCNGILATLVALAMERAGLTYNITVNATGIAADAAVQTSTKAGGTLQPPPFDLSIAFNTVTPSRLAVQSMSVSLYAVDYTMVVDESYAQRATTLVDAVVRPAMWYIFYFFVIAIVSVSGVYLFVELFAGGDESPIRGSPLWSARIQIAFEAGFQTILTCSPGVNLGSRWSRLIGYGGSACGLFLVSILSAIITSKLTSSTLQQSVPSYTDLRNQRVYGSGSVLNPFLTAAGVIVVPVPSIQDAAIRYFNGNPDGVVGFATNTPVAQWLQEQYDTQHVSVLSHPFYLNSGTTEVKALPMSRWLNATTFTAVNVALQSLHDDGTLTSVMNQAIAQPLDSQSDSDIPLADGEVRAAQTAAIALAACGGAMFLCACLRDTMVAVTQQFSGKGAKGHTLVSSFMQNILTVPRETEGDEEEDDADDTNRRPRGPVRLRRRSMSENGIGDRDENDNEDEGGTAMTEESVASPPMTIPAAEKNVTAVFPEARSRGGGAAAAVAAPSYVFHPSFRELEASLLKTGVISPMVVARDVKS